jgi:excisionase family DNA binding protein
MTGSPIYVFEGPRLALTAEELANARDRYEALAPAPCAAPAQAPVAERWLTSRELAELTGVGDTTLEAMAARSEIPHVRVGKALRFVASEVLQALRGRHADRRTAARSQVHVSTGQKTRTTRKPPGLSAPDPQEARPR